MKNDEVRKPIKDKLLWFFIITVILSGIFGNYYYSSIKELHYYIILGWFILSLSVIAMVYFTSLGGKMVFFYKESYSELKRVLWPTRKEAVQTTFMVMVVVLIMAIVLWFLDSLLFLAISYITG